MHAPAHWCHRSWISWLLWPLSYLYYGLVVLRLSRITPLRVGMPIICVGNNTVGGTGKTPTVIHLSQLLRDMGYVPHVISRGYKGQYSGTVHVDPELHIAQEVGDEPLLIARHAPCWVARRRLHAARAAIAAGANVIIMDDGLQNPTLQKDCSLVVVDGSYGFGNGFMMPAGPCREPLSVTMRKADAVVIMGEALNPTIQASIPARLPVFRARLVAQTDREWRNVRVHPFAGIGNPEKFFATMEQLGSVITLTSAFPDHHLFTMKDIERLLREANEHQAQLVTTEKDYMRLPESFRPQVIPIPVQLTIETADSFASFIKTHISNA
jgi:tetraacyldisaccharide 4'-kinase